MKLDCKTKISHRLAASFSVTYIHDYCKLQIQINLTQATKCHPKTLARQMYEIKSFEKQVY